MQTPKTQRNSNKKTLKVVSKKDRNRGERKASVRKQRFEELESGSDLTDVPSSDDDDDTNTNALPASKSGKGKERSIDSLTSDSDTEMEKKLLEAGDGESLLGSAESDEDNEHEEKFIIRDALKREARARAKALRDSGRIPDDGAGGSSGHDWSRKGDAEHRARAAAIRHGSHSNPSTSARGDGQSGSGTTGDDAEGEADAEDEGDDHDADLLSLSPDTFRLYGLPDIEDELFEQQEGFHTSSEPSFTDFFESSTDSEMGAGDGARDDDDEFTTDSEEDEDISDIEGGVLDAPLIAHIGTTQGQTNGDSAGTNSLEASGEIRPEVPLLVIEDLDGRLIYARAGDGEAVFGSDGEFEFVDDSEDDSTDYEYDERGNRSHRDWNPFGLLAPPEDDGDTTDELPDEDMPYPRLLVGSVAPRGGRNSRRARAMAAQSRRLSPAGGVGSALPSPTATHPGSLPLVLADADGSKGEGAQESSASPPEPPMEVDLTISTEALARDPEGTLRAAAEALGVSVEEAAALIAGVEVSQFTNEAGSDGAQQISASSSGSTSTDGTAASTSQGTPKTPEVQRSADFIKPEMGRFIPTSSKSVHRAVIDGSRKAPSPFSGKRSLQKKGLAKKRPAARRSSLDVHMAKRLRRFSSAGASGSAIEDLSEIAGSSPEPEQIDPMELDDVVDSDMLWRGGNSKSPSPEADGSAPEEEQREGKVSRKPVPQRSKSKSGAPGLNLNAFARWDKIPMGTFRDSQVSTGFQTHHQQPLGTFLLTRSQGSAAQRRQEHSPFRTTSDAFRNAETFSISPIRANHETNSSNTNGADRGRSFVISPVLFPTRSGELVTADNTKAPGSLFGLERSSSLPQGPADASLSRQFSNNSAGPGRITRREKRERKARRAALLAAQAEVDDAASVVSARSEPSRSPIPSTPQLPKVSLQGAEQDGSESPASALPKMRITDASPTPRGSPAPSTLPESSKLQHSESSSTGVTNAVPEGSDKSASNSLLVPGPMASDQSRSAVPDNSHDGADGPSRSPSTLGGSGGLPSSACKTPLHSPLFGGIFATMNDDLDDKDGEMTLTI